MIKEKLLSFLNRIQPITGRRVTERGTVVNIADVVEKLAKANDVFGQITVAEYTPIIESKPLPNISVIRDKVTGAGTVDVVNGEIAIDGTAGVTSLYTRKLGRYVPALVSLVGIGVRLPTPNTGHYEFGYGNGSGNRFGLEIDEGEWYTFIESAGTRWYRNPRSQWEDPLDGTGASGLNLDDAQFVFRMPFGWYGYLSVVFIIIITTPTGDTAVQIDSSGGRLGAVTIEQPDLPIFAEATGGVLNVGGRQYGVFGRYAPLKRITSTDRVTVAGITAPTPIVSLKVKGDIKFLGIPVELIGSSLLSLNDAYISIIIDGTLDQQNFLDIDGIAPTETALQSDKTATSITGGYRAYSTVIGGGQGAELGDTEDALPAIEIPSGSIVTLVMSPIDTSTDVTVVLRAKEEW